MGLSSLSILYKDLLEEIDSIDFCIQESMLVLIKPIFSNNLIMGIKEKARAALGCNPLGIIITSAFNFSNLSAKIPPVVSPQRTALFLIASSNEDSVSSVLPEYEESITKVLFVTHSGIE